MLKECTGTMHAGMQHKRGDRWPWPPSRWHGKAAPGGTQQRSEMQGAAEAAQGCMSMRFGRGLPELMGATLAPEAWNSS